VRDVERHVLAWRARALVTMVDVDDDTPPWLRYVEVDDGELLWRLRDDFDVPKGDEPLRRAGETVVDPAPRRITTPQPVLTSDVVDLRRPTPDKHRWVVDELILTGELVFLVAPAFTGKTTLALDLAGCVATGQPFLGREVTQGRALYVTREARDDDDIPTVL